MIYYLLLIYLVALSYLYDFKNHKYGKTINKYILFSLLIFTAGLRYRLGPDSVYYMFYFENESVDILGLNSNVFLNSRYMPLWVLLNAAFKIFNSIILFQIACTAIFHYALFYFINKVTEIFFSSVLLYFILCFAYFNMEIVRESLAISMFLVAIVKLNEKKIFQCYLFILFAFLWHQFAAMLFVVPLFLTNSVSIKFKLIIMFSLCCCFYFIEEPLIMLGGLVKYDLSFYDIAKEMSVWGYTYNIIRLLPAIISLFYFSRKSKITYLKLDKNIIVGLVILYVVVIFIRIASIPFFDRISNYFILFVIIFSIAFIFSYLNKFRIRILRYPIFLSLSMVVLIFYIIPLTKVDPLFNSPPIKRYYPYYSFFSKKVDPDRERISQLEAKE